MLSSIRARRKKWRVTPSMISRLSNKALKSIVASMPAAFLIESLKLGNVSAKVFSSSSSQLFQFRIGGYEFGEALRAVCGCEPEQPRSVIFRAPL